MQKRIPCSSLQIMNRLTLWDILFPYLIVKIVQISGHENMNVSHDLQHIQALYKEMQLTLQLTKKPVSRPQAKICQRSVSITNKVIFHFDR